MTRLLRLGSQDRLLLLAPHPDDETLAAGGLLQRAVSVHASVRVVFVTDGENNPWAQRFTERRWHIGSAERERWGSRRRLEALAALACLGVSPRQVEFLGFPDQGLTDLLCSGDEDLADSMAREILRYRPTLLAGPAPEDLHPDHSALSQVLRLVLARSAVRLPRMLERHFIVHHHGPIERIAEASLALTASERERKREAILCHASQLTMRREALLAFAGPEEVFFGVLPPAENRGDHPVTRAFVEGETLHLDLDRRSRAGAFGRTRLLLHVAEPGGASRTFTANLPRRPGALDLFDDATGRLVARGLFRRGPHRERVVLPASLVEGWSQAGVKLERRFGFFDEAGWRALPPHLLRVDSQLVPVAPGGAKGEALALGRQEFTEP